MLVQLIRPETPCLSELVGNPEDRFSRVAALKEGYRRIRKLAMQHTETVFSCKNRKKNHQKSFDIFLIFAPKHRLWVLVTTASSRRSGSNEYPQSMFWGDAVLTSIHNLCFGAKIRKIGKSLQTPVFLYKSVV